MILEFIAVMAFLIVFLVIIELIRKLNLNWGIKVLIYLIIVSITPLQSYFDCFAPNLTEIRFMLWLGIFAVVVLGRSVWKLFKNR